MNLGVRLAACSVAVAAIGLSPAGARADGESLPQAAERVASEWIKGGAVIDRGEARFLYDNLPILVALPPSTVQTPCTTVALLGARGLSFHAKVAGAPDDPLDDDKAVRAASVGGVLEMGGCGPSVRLDRLFVRTDAGRGAIEVVVAHSSAPLAALHTVLPERTGGVLPPPPDAGQPPLLSSPSKRADSAEARAKRDGGEPQARASWPASRNGSGEAKLVLDEGCHRIEIFATDARGPRGARRRRLDVDADLRDEDRDLHLIARDRTDNPDARLEVCVGEPTRVAVLFAGAPAESDVTVTHATWAIPEHLPSLWGPLARARMARTLLERRLRPPSEDAVALYRGVSGTTPMPFEIEPGACYLAAAAAVTDGPVRGLALRVLVGGRDVRSERSADDDAGVVAFCAEDEARARFEVEAHPHGLTWGLALFRVGARTWGDR